MQSSDRKQLIHRATWVYCGDRFHWVQMAADNAAAFRAQMSQAAAVLAEAIPYDLYISRKPRALTVKNVCMDFSDLPSRTDQAPVVLASPQPIPLTPSATSTPATAPVQTSAQPAGARTKVVAIGAVDSSHDGVWKMDMQVTTTNGNAVGGECQPYPSIRLSFINESANGPSTKLRLTSDGGISGWMLAPAIGTTAVPFIVKVSGRLEDDVFNGSVSGRCTGSFTMRKQ